MRLLLANHIDGALLAQADQRMFVHRILWLSQPGDVIVLPCSPELTFVDHVAQHIGFDPSTLRFIDISKFCGDNRLFNDDALLLPAVIDFIREFAADITEILPLWPSPQVARMAQATGLSLAFSGCEFFAQLGDEFVNSKANFRRIAAGIDVKIAPGAVCRTLTDAVYVTRQLLACHRGVVVKQAQNHAAAGNLLVSRDESSDRFNGGFLHFLSLHGQTETLSTQLEGKWAWATRHGASAVSIEAFVENTETIYVEFFVEETRLTYVGSGTLGYQSGGLVSEAAPLKLAGSTQWAQLLDQGRQLAQAYQAIGYRGYLSADALLTPKGDIVFTEVNARIGGSPHIYFGIAERVVRCGAQPDRIVTQRLFSPDWRIACPQAFLDAIARADLQYDPCHRKGVLLSTPPIKGHGVTPPFFVAIVHGLDEDPQVTMQQLDRIFLPEKTHA